MTDDTLPGRDACTLAFGDLFWQLDSLSNGIWTWLHGALDRCVGVFPTGRSVYSSGRLTSDRGNVVHEIDSLSAPCRGHRMKMRHSRLFADIKFLLQ